MVMMARRHGCLLNIGIRQPENKRNAIVGRFSGCLQGSDGAMVVVFWLHIIFHKFTACKPK